MNLLLLSSLLSVTGNALYQVIRIYFLIKKERQNIKIKG